MNRLDELRRRFDEREIHALVVTNRTNIRYLTGFSGSNGTLAVTNDGAVLITDSRYEERAAAELAAAQAHGVDLRITRDTDSALADILDSERPIGLEADDVTWARLDAFRELFGTLTPTTHLIEDLRERKAGPELDAVRRAAAIADAALAELRPRLAQQPSESDFAHLLDQAMRHAGADGPGFETIVASGPNSARPHHRAGDRVIGSGDLVVIDFGAEVDGYRSDMTRTFVIGPPTDRQTELLDAVLAAQAAGVDTAGPGVPAADVDAACRARLESASLAEYFTHGSGHGVGLDIHEAPWVNARATATLAPGHVITVEPGVYIPDFGGVRWEDTLVITESGAEAVTTAPKDPIVG